MYNIEVCASRDSLLLKSVFFSPSGLPLGQAKKLGEGTYGSVSSARRNTEWIDMEKLEPPLLGFGFVAPFVGTRRLGQCVLSRPCRRCNGWEIVGDRTLCWSLRLVEKIRNWINSKSGVADLCFVLFISDPFWIFLIWQKRLKARLDVQGHVKNMERFQQEIAIMKASPVFSY